MLRILFWFIITFSHLNAACLMRSVIQCSHKITGLRSPIHHVIISQSRNHSTYAERYVGNVLTACHIKIHPNSPFWDTSALLGVIELLDEGVPATEIRKLIPHANIAIIFLLEESFKTAKASHIQGFMQ